jgi:hypothetical protein
VPALDVVLTVAQSKRLIAKAIPQVEVVRRALAEGTVVVCRGSTTAYVAEELLGRPLAKGSFIAGRVVPAGFVAPAGLWGEARPEVVLRRGQPTQVASLAEALEQLQPGDVVIKGANALDYRAGLVGHLIGHPTGGTMGAILGPIHGQGAHLVVPVGLEKLIASDLLTTAARLDATHAEVGLPRLWVTRGLIVTEIEALATLTGVEAVHVASGGICGAEGAVWLRVLGTNEQLERTVRLVSEVQKEPPYLDSCLAQSRQGGEGDG